LHHISPEFNGSTSDGHVMTDTLLPADKF